MKCNSCNLSFTNNWDKFCIKTTKRCVSCQKDFEAKPENDPENKKFVVTYEYSTEDQVIIYAKNEKEAEEQFENGYEYDEYEIREENK